MSAKKNKPARRSSNKLSTSTAKPTKDAKDANDVLVARGPKELRAGIAAAKKPEPFKEPEPMGTAKDKAKNKARVKAPQAAAGAAAESQTIPHPHGGGSFLADDQGVWFDPPDTAKNAARIWLSSPIRLLAATRDDGGKEWGRLLEVVDSDGVVHRWSMPAELLAADGSDLRRELLRLGASIATLPKARALLTTYLTEVVPTDRARCVCRTGWHGEFYVLPNAVIGEVAR